MDGAVDRQVAWRALSDLVASFTQQPAPTVTGTILIASPRRTSMRSFPDSGSSFASFGPVTQGR